MGRRGGDGGQLPGRIVVEAQDVREAAQQTRVGPQQPLHRLRVAGKDAAKRGAVVFELRQQRAKRLVGKRVASVAVTRAGECVRLVQEEAAAHRRGDHLLNLRARPPDVRPLELEGVPLDEDVLLQQPVRAQPSREQPRCGRLAGAWIAGEHDVEAALEQARVAAACHVLHLGLQLREECLERRHPRESLHLRPHRPPLLRQRREAVRRVESEVRLGEEEWRALQSAQGQPRVARRDCTLRELARKVCVAERDHVTLQHRCQRQQHSSISAGTGRAIPSAGTTV
mmetsp:Transcript_9820/g.29020  ORF Transcript_9820/g.29020 Transcript_9820/m.29020 type:complete len:284 (+) Transcript_9820:619-1470(+)